MLRSDEDSAFSYTTHKFHLLDLGAEGPIISPSHQDGLGGRFFVMTSYTTECNQYFLPSWNRAPKEGSQKYWNVGACIWGLKLKLNESMNKSNLLDVQADASAGVAVGLASISIHKKIITPRFWHQLILIKFKNTQNTLNYWTCAKYEYLVK